MNNRGIKLRKEMTAIQYTASAAGGFKNTTAGDASRDPRESMTGDKQRLARTNDRDSINRYQLGGMEYERSKRDATKERQGQ